MQRYGSQTHQEANRRADSSGWWAGDSTALMGLTLSCAVLIDNTARLPQCYLPQAKWRKLWSDARALVRLPQNPGQWESWPWLCIHKFHKEKTAVTCPWLSSNGTQVPLLRTALCSHTKNSALFYTIWFLLSPSTPAFPRRCGSSSTM